MAYKDWPCGNEEYRQVDITKHVISLDNVRPAAINGKLMTSLAEWSRTFPSGQILAVWRTAKLCGGGHTSGPAKMPQNSLQLGRKYPALEITRSQPSRQMMKTFRIWCGLCSRQRRRKTGVPFLS